MTRKKKNICNQKGMYWESAAYNARVLRMFREQILALAISRFEWRGLPKTCDARYLEWTLLTRGFATIASPPKMPGVLYSTQAAQTGIPNVYDNPVTWQSYGNNGWQFDVSMRTGVLVWDNMLRIPIWDWMQIYAAELTDIMRTMQVNRVHVKQPIIFKGDRRRKMDLVNIFKQVAGYEPAIIATDAMDSIETDVMSTGVPFLGKELNEALNNTWAQVYTMLGIPNLAFKAERQIQDEVKTHEAPVELMALYPLKARRQACDRLNELFGDILDEPISVTWATDYQSNNHELQTDIGKRAQMLGELV